jgi:hypothetical protein
VERCTGYPREASSSATAAAIAAVAGGEHRVDHELLVVEAERVQLARAARGLAHRGVVGACHEHDGGVGRVGERGHRGGELVVLQLQAGMRTETRLAVRRVFEKARPRARQAEQAQRVARGRRIEDHVVPALAATREQRRELVEGGDLGRARARELLLELGELRRVPEVPIRRDDALAVVGRRLLGIDVECEQSRRPGDRSDDS